MAQVRAAVLRAGSPGPGHTAEAIPLGSGGIGQTPYLGPGAPLPHSGCHLCPTSHGSQGFCYPGAGWGGALGLGSALGACPEPSRTEAVRLPPWPSPMS